MEIVNGIPHSYLGDGVYAEWDPQSGGVWLRTGSHTSPKLVFLEMPVLEALSNFVNESLEHDLNEVDRYDCLIHGLQDGKDCPNC